MTKISRRARCAVIVAALVSPIPAYSATASQANVDREIADAKSAMLIDPSSALSKAAAAKVRAQQLRNGNLKAIAIATADWLQAEALVRLDKPALAMPIAMRALQIETKVAPRSKLQADTLRTRGGVYGDLNEFGLALANYQAAYHVYSLINDQRGKTVSILDIGELYRQAKDYDNAIKYIKQAKDLINPDDGLKLSINTNLAIIFQRIGRFHEAEKQFSQALLLAKKLESPELIAVTWRHIAQCQLASHDLASAERSIAAANLVAFKARLKDDPILLSTMAQAALMRGERDTARQLVDRAFAGIDPAHTSLSLREAHQTAYEVYRATGSPEMALVHLVALKRLDDEATKLATTASTALMAARFDFAKMKADELQRTIGYERQRVKTERYAFFVVMAAAVVVMALLVFALFTSRRSRIRVAAANADLAQTNVALGKALAAKTEFLATTSHEIRTPLNGILGMAQVMLADPTIGAETRDRLGIVHGAGITMRALVDDILDVAKMETGNLTIEQAPFDLAATIRDATRLWEDQARAKGVAFACDLGRSPRMIEGDAARVRQIVFNLLSNALKFTAAGRIDLVVADAGEGRYAVAVSDTGIGIPADKTEEIFESFRQADAGTTRQFGGTGLGLSICRSLARAMGGDIAVASVPGQGSTFTVTLPRIDAAEPVACAAVGDVGPGILIVDRNPISRAMLRTLLSPAAGSVAVASSAAEAVECLPSMTVAQVLIDDATIRSGGEPLADLARIAAVAKASGTRTALLWPVSAAQERDELIATGIDLVIAKPVSGAALVQHLATLAEVGNEALVSRAA